MSKGWEGNFFEDFELGQQIECPIPRRIGEGEVAAYIALTGDRTPGYCGPAGLVHPLVVFHTVLGQTVRPVSLNARANLGYARMRWHRPLEVGATLRTTATIVGLKENSSRRDGIVWLETAGADAEGEVLSYVRWVMVRKRGSDPTRWLVEPAQPEPHAALEARDLPSRSGALPPALETGGRYWFEDYVPGERIQHVDGVTVNPSDHMTFTRLFQNSARVHFDALAGEPLVFGGYVISIGYAQAFNGFENRLGLVAINGGTHANPVRAGDTLFSFSDVLETTPVSDPVCGAVRCRLVVVKNEKPSGVGQSYAIYEQGRYRPNVVLDLDYWEMVGRRAAGTAERVASGTTP